MTTLTTLEINLKSSSQSGVPIIWSSTGGATNEKKINNTISRLRYAYTHTLTQTKYRIEAKRQCGPSSLRANGRIETVKMQA